MSLSQWETMTIHIAQFNIKREGKKGMGRLTAADSTRPAQPDRVNATPSQRWPSHRRPNSTPNLELAYSYFNFFPFLIDALV